MKRTSVVDNDTAARLRVAVARLHRRLKSDATGDLPPLPLAALLNIEQHEPLRLSELARLEGVSAPTMSRALVALDERGVIHRSIDPNDARSTLVQVTPAGHALLAQVRAKYTESLFQRMERLDAGQRAALIGALPALEALVDER